VINRYLRTSEELEPAYPVPHGNPHLPFRVLTSMPLALLPYWLAGVLWTVLSAAVLVWAVFTTESVPRKRGNSKSKITP